jgi:hypothetical protein
MKTIITFIIICSTLIIGCSKSDKASPTSSSTPNVSTPPAAASFTCLVDGQPFTATKISCSMFANISVIAIDSTSSGIQEVYFDVVPQPGTYPSNAIGTFSLAAPASYAAVNGGTYEVGSSSANLTYFYVQNMSPGSVTISQINQSGQHNSLVSGTFKFQAFSILGAYHTITNGVFSNLSVPD